MLHYRTEILIPTDRYVCLQLPDDLPEGRATITVQIVESDDPDTTQPGSEFEPDHQDIEWWEEFEGNREAPD